MDTSALRAELKTWERNFKKENAREPSVQDIKNEPAIAEKYRLYQKLSKTLVAPALKRKAKDPPSTPPRPQSRPVASTLSIIPKSRAVKVTEPLPTSNPFSPVKNKEKQKSTFSLDAGPREDMRRNPFLTPVKPKVQQRLSSTSPDPFLTSRPETSGASSSQLPAPPNTAITRARKRLRGDPVSPSPKGKGKRQRVSSQAPSLLCFNDDTVTKIDKDDDLDDDEEIHTSFVDDSPVKAPAGAKSFKLLFEEAPPASQPLNGTKVQKKTSLARSKTTPVGVGLFGVRRARGGSVSAKALIGSTTAKGESKMVRNGQMLISAMLPGKDPTTKVASSTVTRAVRAGENHKNLSKRALSDSESESGIKPAEPSSKIGSKEIMLPPSPPPETNRFSSKYNKGKGKATNRKKLKLRQEAEEDDEDEDSVGDENVKVLDWNAKRGRVQDNREMDGFDVDLDGLHIRHTFNGTPSGVEDFEVDAPGEFEVDLPDELRRVLAISPSKLGDSKEENLVRGLLYGGERDATYVGEVYGVGEEDGADEDGEDEWAGEGVPWEAAEL